MTFKEISTMIKNIGLPFAYYQFPEGTAEAPPFICFYYSNDDDFKADDSNHDVVYCSLDYHYGACCNEFYGFYNVKYYRLTK